VKIKIHITNSDNMLVCETVMTVHASEKVSE